MALISKNAKLWPGGIVPFVFDQSLNSGQKGIITAGFALFAGVCPGVTFVGHASEPNWLHFMIYPDPGGHSGSDSSIGMHPGPQFIWLSSAIGTGPGGPVAGAANAAHEICHALGLLHEQTRSDRSSFVSINFSNIALIHQDQFKSDPRDKPVDVGRYDKLSRMHYQRRDYAINPTIDTVTPLVAPPALVTGTPPTSDFSGVTLSAGDVGAINPLYPPSAPFGESSDTGPALAGRGDTLLLAWKGNGNASLATMTSTSGISTSGTPSSTNGNTFSAKTTLSENSSTAPALAVLGPNFVIAWTGQGNNQLNIMQSSDGSHWHSKVTLNDTSPSAPALAHIGAEIFLAWRGGDNRLNLIRSIDGTHWSPKQTINETTDSGPALSSTGPNLLLVWRGRGNNNINVIGAPGGIITAGPGGIRPPGYFKVTLSDTTDDRPAICRTDSNVYLAWRGPGNVLMNVMKSSDGQNWSTKITVNAEHLGAGPAIVSWNHVLVRAWTESAAGSLRSRAFQEF